MNVCAGDDAPIGHGLAACTTSITAVRFAIPYLTSSAIVLVDTPGLDSLPGYEVSRNICDWFKKLLVFFGLIVPQALILVVGIRDGLT